MWTVELTEYFEITDNHASYKLYTEHLPTYLTPEFFYNTLT